MLTNGKGQTERQGIMENQEKIKALELEYEVKRYLMFYADYESPTGAELLLMKVARYLWQESVKEEVQA